MSGMTMRSKYEDGLMVWMRVLVSKADWNSRLIRATKFELVIIEDYPLSRSTHKLMEAPPLSIAHYVDADPDQQADSSNQRRQLHGNKVFPLMGNRYSMAVEDSAF